MGLKLLNPDDLGYDVILLAGQSNEVGYGTGIDVTYLDVTDSRVWQWPGSGSYLGQIIAAMDPLFHHEQAAGTVGSGMSFARKYARSIPQNRRVLLVPTAHGSTGFTTSSVVSPPTGYTYTAGGGWDPTGGQGGINLYQYAIAQANAAIAADPGNRIVGIIWCQGEADASLSQSAYATKLDSLIAGFRAGITGATNVPVLIQQMLPEYIAASTPGKGINAAHIDTPNRNQRTAFNYGQTGYVFTGDGLNLHYTAAGQRINGHALYTALLRARANVTGVAPVIPTGATVKQTGAGAVTISWSQNIGRVTDYNVRYSTDGGTTWTTITRTQSIDNTAALTGLAAGASVTAQTRAINEQGISAWSASSAATVIVAAPGQVIGLAAGSITSTAVTLTWTATSGATSYLAEKSSDGGTTWTTVGTVTTTMTTAIGLSPSTSYRFRVTASNVAGSGTASSTVTATTSAPSPYVTDVGVTPYRAVGLRKLSSSYNGNAVLVRRSSDNTTQAIGFAAGTNDLDTAALTTFCGAGNGFIQTWYDQSGSGRDLTQATAANQAQIVNAGAVLTQNGHPAATFNGTSHVYVDSTNFGLYAGGAASQQAVVNATASSSFPPILAEMGAATTGAIYSLLGTGSSNNTYNVTRDDSNASLGVGAGALTGFTGALVQESTVDTGTTLQLWLNGTAGSLSTYTRSGHTLTITRAALGGVPSGSYWPGSVCEIVQFPVALTTAQRTAGQANQKAYYTTA